MEEVAVIGGGLAGLSAALHGARLGRLVTLFEGSGLYGGLVATVDEVDGLGVAGHHSGQAVAMHLLEQAKKQGVQVVEWPVVRVELGERIALTTEDGKTCHPEAVIVASGAGLRRLGVPGEEKFTGRGVSRCATCDGGFYRGRDVAVIGTGDAAVTEALVLAKTSRTVTMVCRSPIKAKPIYVDRLAARDNVRFAWDSEVVEVMGENSVAGLRLRNVRTGNESTLEVAGVFPFIGVEPNAAFLPPGLLNNDGTVRADASTASTDPRLFAAGAVREGYGGNVAQAMAEGIAAAEAAAKLLAGRG
ncbi:MAG: FAD-dependent oxidoreductase [Sphingomonadales bacterium]|nr:FAD-dependent oxidoreductase [Sphingomonadales bacterium]